VAPRIQNDLFRRKTKEVVERAGVIYKILIEDQIFKTQE